jgi:hypothetical protein
LTRVDGLGLRRETHEVSLNFTANFALLSRPGRRMIIGVHLLAGWSGSSRFSCWDDYELPRFKTALAVDYHPSLC